MPGLIIAAPRSGSGKTVVTIGLLRALRQAGVRVAAAKVGPDYIDPSFLAAAAASPCRNLDSWAMRRETLAAEIHALEASADLVLCEGVMGLFDGAGMASAGSTAALAALTGWPVILVVSLEGQAASAAALIEGFARHRTDVTIAGVIFNRSASERHAAIAAAAVARTLPALPILGAIPRGADLELPSRHLGLIPAGEHLALDDFLDHAAAAVSRAIDLGKLRGLARTAALRAPACASPLPALGKRIAVARDRAFAFAYDALLEGWRAEGAALRFFSPLDDAAPPRDADAVYLPGGYPELHAAKLSAASRFFGGLRGGDRTIYGECGGYMVLGETLTDASGQPHRMAGLLTLKTSFAERRRHLGYRSVRLLARGPLGDEDAGFRGHEFHYTTIIEEKGDPLFSLADASGNDLRRAGLRCGKIFGSFIHLIDSAD